MTQGMNMPIQSPMQKLIEHRKAYLAEHGCMPREVRISQELNNQVVETLNKLGGWTAVERAPRTDGGLGVVIEPALRDDEIVCV